MNNKRSKNHHYVPQVLQRQFAAKEDSSKIWYSKRQGDGTFTTPKLRSYKKIFMERDRNTILENVGLL